MICFYLSADIYKHDKLLYNESNENSHREKEGIGL